MANSLTYVLDDWERGGGPTRKWDQIVGEHTPCHWDRHLKKIVLASRDDLKNGLVIIHRSFLGDYGDIKLPVLEAFSKQNPGLICVVVSAGQQREAGTRIPRKLY